MKTRIFFVVLMATMILPGFFISCSPDMSHELQTIDSLKTQVQNAKKDFMSIDTQRISQINETALKNLTAIKNMYQPGDTLTMEIGQRITSYKGFKKAGMKMSGMRKTLREEFTYTEQQLNNLANDIKNHTLNPDSVKVYLKTETEATMRLLSSYQAYKQTHDQAIKDFDSLNPIIENMIREQELKKLAALINEKN
ncbi:MAG: hypothetical protein ACOZCO_16305 [Bacteroidota bacterium]